jgi:LysM repeat protein
MPIFRAVYTGWATLFLFISSIATVIPTTANAGIFSTFVSTLFSGGSNSSLSVNNENLNSQNLPLLQSSVNFDILAAKGDGDIITVGNEALMSENGPSGTLADIDETTNNGQISKYTVRKGDTLSSVAKMFGVSSNTIIWANDISSISLKEGQVLVILPVSGTVHTVLKGDTLKSIAKKYKADANEIAQFNDLNSDSVLAVGDTIVIPDGEGAARISGSSAKSNPLRGGSGPDYAGYFIRPLVGGIRTQGLHGYNGIDIGTYVGTPIMAAASGEIIIARSSGWNGGYGKYVVISHYNGTQTLYAHLSSTYVSVGERVSQGQVIGLSGNTGNSTGPHLHFEVRGAKNFLAN